MALKKMLIEATLKYCFWLRTIRCTNTRASFQMSIFSSISTNYDHCLSDVAQMSLLLLLLNTMTPFSGLRKIQEKYSFYKSAVQVQCRVHELAASGSDGRNWEIFNIFFLAVFGLFFTAPICSNTAESKI